LTRERPPAPIVKKTASGLSPVAVFDAEELDAMPIGTEFDLVCRSNRSWPQLRTYWRTLSMTVQATGKWETREQLHSALKVRLGYVDPVLDLKGNVIGMQPMSAALDKMTHAEFCEYMDKAMTALSEAVGYDVLEWYNAP